MLTPIQFAKDQVREALRRVNGELGALGFRKQQGESFCENDETFVNIEPIKLLSGSRLEFGVGVTLKSMLPNNCDIKFDSAWDADHTHIMGAAAYWSVTENRWIAPVFNPNSSPILNAWDQFAAREYRSFEEAEEFVRVIVDQCAPRLMKLSTKAGILREYAENKLLPLTLTLAARKHLGLPA